MTHIFPTDFPAGLFLVQLLGDIITLETDDDVTLYGTQRADLRCTSRAGHRTDSDVEWSRRGRGTVVGKLAVVKITLENDQVGTREMQEEIGSFAVQVPEGISCAPERVLLVDPLSLAFVLLLYTWSERRQSRSKV